MCVTKSKAFRLEKQGQHFCSFFFEILKAEMFEIL